MDEFYLERELQCAEQLAREAGEIARREQGNTQIDYKPNNEGPVTNIDLLADQIITNGIQKEFPSDIIISEEAEINQPDFKSANRVWFIDPIDGTKDYIAGGNDYSVMIGLCIDGKPVLGVVYQPNTDILWRGVDTRGVMETPFVRTERVCGNQIETIHINNEPSPNQLTLIKSKSHASELDDYIHHYLKTDKVLQRGSVGLKMAGVAQGDAQVYVSNTRRLKVWDTCGPSVIAKAAGCIVEDICGNALDYQNQLQHNVHIFVTRPELADWVKSQFPAALKAFQESFLI